MDAPNPCIRIRERLCEKAVQLEESLTQNLDITVLEQEPDAASAYDSSPSTSSSSHT
jgi:hypothetical protein